MKVIVTVGTLILMIMLMVGMAFEVKAKQKLEPTDFYLQVFDVRKRDWITLNRPYDDYPDAERNQAACETTATVLGTEIRLRRSQYPVGTFKFDTMAYRCVREDQK